MNQSKLYDLAPLLGRVEDLQPGEKVEVLEMSVGCLYVGTSQGSLLQYGVTEITGVDGLKSLTASFISRTVVSSGAKITFLYAAPAINRMLVMTDSSLNILNMSDLTVLPMAASNKLKGLSAVCVNVNPVSDNPFSVEICVAKKKQCQLAVLILTEEKMSVWRTRDCSEPVVTLAMDGPYICAALQSEYVVFNMDSLSLTPLFPLEPGVVPIITRTDREEWLVSGPGNLGMFVRSDGSVSRPPIQWSPSLASVTFTNTHIISHDNLTVSVYDINDQSMKQGLPYTGGRFLGFCDGHVLLASSASIDILAPVPWQQQADSLLESGQLEEAIKMAGDNQGGDFVKQKAGFVYLKQAEFEEAQDEQFIANIKKSYYHQLGLSQAEINNAIFVTKPGAGATIWSI